MRFSHALLATSVLAALLALTACEDADSGGGGGAEPGTLPGAACDVLKRGIQVVDARELAPLEVVRAATAYEITLAPDDDDIPGALELDLTKAGDYAFYFRGQVDMQLNTPQGDIVAPSEPYCVACGACGLDTAHTYKQLRAGSYVVYMVPLDQTQWTTTLVTVSADDIRPSDG